MGLPFLDDHRLLRERKPALKLASIAYHTALLKTSPQRNFPWRPCKSDP
jgi:hypothetical protein